MVSSFLEKLLSSLLVGRAMRRLWCIVAAVATLSMLATWLSQVPTPSRVCLIIHDIREFD